MKKNILLIVVGVALIASACSHEGELAPAGRPGAAPAAPATRLVTLSAYSADTAPSTKTSRDDEGTFYWSPEDQISVFYGSGTNGGAVFTSTNSARAEKTDFTGEIDTESGSEGDSSESKKYLAVYPYSTVNSFDGTTLTTEILSAQVAAEGTFADGMLVSIGSSESLSMGFYHLCGGIKFFLGQEGITRISLSGNAGETLAGTVEVTVDENHHPSVQKVKTAAKEIVITPPDGKESFSPGITYYFVTLPVTFSKGFTVAFEKGESYGVRTVDVNMTVNRAKFRYSNVALDAGVEFVTEGTFSESEYQDIENAKARAYLENVNYTDFDTYEASEIGKYTQSGSDRPAPVSISWSGTASSVILSASKSLDNDVQTVSASTSSASVYNLVPGVTYYYKVVSGKGFTLKEGSVVPVGPLRMIRAGSTRNIRDLGGWTGEGGKTLAYGKLYRGAQISSSDGSVFQSLGIGVDLDLRGYQSGAGSGGGSSSGPGGGSSKGGGQSSSGVLSFLEYKNIKVCQFMYENGTQGVTQELYQEALHYVINCLDNDIVVYFHCVGGADRTGTLAFLIEALLGVSENDLSKDYELTSFYMTRERNDEKDRPFKQLVFYLKSDQFGDESTTIQQRVYNWATTRFSDSVDPLTDDEINILKTRMLQ